MESPIRHDPPQVPSAGDPHTARLAAEAARYGAARGQLIVRAFEESIGDAPPDGGLQEMIRDLDGRFAAELRGNGQRPAGSADLREALTRIACSAQNTAVFEALSARFFEIGQRYGLTQGRTIEEPGYRETRAGLESLERAVARCFVSTETTVGQIPRGVTLTAPPRDALQVALLASARQGERIGIDRRIEAEIDAAKIHRTTAGWKTFLPTWFPLFKPFSRVLAILAGKSAEQLGFIDAAMEDLRGISLEAALTHAYGRRFLNRIRWLIKGDQTGSRAIRGARALRAWWSTKTGRSDRVCESYAQIESREMPRFERLLARDAGIGPDHLHAALRQRLTPAGLERIEQLRRGDPIAERVIRLHDLIHSRRARQAGLRHVFRHLSPDELDRCTAGYRARYHEDLAVAVANRLRPSAARDLCLAILNHDPERTAAARIRCTFEHREDFIGGPFLHKSADERARMIELYEKLYHAGRHRFWSDLQSAARREDFLLASVPLLAPLLEWLSWPATTSSSFLESIVTNGRLAPAELLRYFMSGIGTDIEGIHAVLSDCTKEEIGEIERDYARRYPPTRRVALISRIPMARELFPVGDLRHDLRVELSGDQEFDILLHMEGLPDGNDERAMCETLLHRVKQRYEHERSGSLMRLRRGMISTWRGDGRIVLQFENDFKVATDYYEAHIRDPADLSPHHVKRFSTLVRLAETQADAYREAKIAVSELILNSGAVIGATLGAASVVAISALPWWTGPIASGLGSLGWRWLHGRLILGRGFGRTDATFQAVRAFIDGASLFMITAGVATFSELLGRQLSGAATKGSFKTSLHRFMRTIEDGIKHNNKARRVLEKGDALASDDELESLRRGFYDALKTHVDALTSTSLTGGVSLQQVIAGAVP